MNYSKIGNQYNLFLSFIIGLIIGFIRVGANREFLFYFGFSLFFLVLVCSVGFIVGAIHFFIIKSNIQHINDGLIDSNRKTLKVHFAELFYFYTLIVSPIIGIIYVFR